MVEFAFVAVLFFTLLIGIISFGVLLAFKQNMTQAASESARASIAVEDDDTTPVDERKEVALSSMAASMGEFDRECDVTATCMVLVHDCDSAANFGTIPDPQNSTAMALWQGPEPENTCLTARIEFTNSGSSRILPPFPIISAFEPDTLTSQTTVRLVAVSSVTP